MNSQNLPQFLSLFSIITMAGAILGLTLTAWRASEHKILYTDTGMSVLLGALLGARAGYVLRNWAYFTANAAEIPQVWLGGLTWPGALLGGLTVLGVVALITKHPPGKLADALLPLLGALAFSLWLACWADGCAYGPRGEGWWSVPVRGPFGVVEDRWPLQPVGAILSLVPVAAAETLRTRRWSSAPDRSALLGVGGLSLLTLILSLFRVDPSPHLWGLRWESWFAIFFTLASVGAFFAEGEGADEPEEAKDAEEPSSD